jgi:hypothetical protein
MNGLIAFVWPDRRMGRGDFLFGLAVSFVLAVGGAAMAYIGQVTGAALYLLGVWIWLVVHINRRHDHHQGGGALVLAWPLVLFGTALAAAVLVVTTGVGLPAPDARPTGEETAFVWAYVGAAILFSLAEVDPAAIPDLRAGLITLALLPLAASTVVSILIGTAPEAPEPNRWGPPPR